MSALAVSHAVVESRQDYQLPQIVYDTLRLVVALQPVVAALRVEGLTVLQAVRQADPRQPVERQQLVAEPDVRVTQEGRDHVKPAQPRCAGQHTGPPVAHDLDPQARLKVRLVQSAHCLEEVDVVPAATHEDMLAVVHLLAGLAVAERERPAAEERALFDHRHLQTVLQQPQRSREAGEAAP